MRQIAHPNTQLLHAYKQLPHRY